MNEKKIAYRQATTLGELLSSPVVPDALTTKVASRLHDQIDETGTPIEPPEVTWRATGHYGQGFDFRVEVVYPASLFVVAMSDPHFARAVEARLWSMASYAIKSAGEDPDLKLFRVRWYCEGLAYVRTP